MVVNTFQLFKTSAFFWFLFHLWWTISLLLALMMVPWSCLTSIICHQKLQISIAVLLLWLMIILSNWLLFTSIRRMISFLLVVTRKMLLYMTSAVENVCNCSLICIKNQLMLLSLQTIPPFCLLPHHLTVMSRCGIWDRTQCGLAIQLQVQEEMWWFAFLLMTYICLFQLLTMRYTFLL